MSSNPSTSSTLAPRIPPADTGPVPILHELKISKDAEEWLKTISPSTFANYDQIQKTWNSPLTQFTLTLVQDAELKGAVSEIAGSHLYGEFFSYEAALILILWIFRVWRLSKVKNWLRSLWTQAWIGMVYWVFAVFLIPGLVWGSAYRTVLSHLAKAVIRHFFA